MYVRSFKNEDNDLVKDLIGSIMAKEYPQEQKAYQYNDLNAIDKAYGKIREKFLVAEEASRIIGTVGIKEDSEKVALMRRLFVHNSHRGRGMGSMLVDTALDFCKMNEYASVHFRATSKMTAAIDLLCNKKGFVEKGRLPFEGIEIVDLEYKIR